MLYEHKARSDGCTEEVSIGLLLAQKGLAKYADYEKATHEEESDTNLEGSCESEEKTLEFQESELNFTSAISETSAESRNSSSSADLLEKIISPKVSFVPAKQQVLKPSELTTKSEDQTAKNCESEEKRTELGSSSVNSEDGSSPPTPTNANTSRDQEETTSPQPVSTDHVTEVTSSDTDLSSAEVNHNSVESSV